MIRPKTIRAGLKAWIALGVGVTAYELMARDGELLSECVDRGIERHPVLIRGTLITVALHLANLIPEQVDPIHHLAVKIGRAKR